MPVRCSYKTPLCLMFPASHIALACIWTVMKLLRLDTRLLDTSGRIWWHAGGMGEQELQGRGEGGGGGRGEGAETGGFLH